MPVGEVVVSDTSPLLNLALIGRLGLLDRQFGTVTGPRQVWRELTAGEDGADEREGRQVARRHGIPVTGIVGVLLRAGRNDVVDVRSELDALRDAGFWLSDELYESAIERANDVE